MFHTKTNLATAFAGLLTLVSPAWADTAAVSGAPNATAVIDGRQLPAPPEAFGGQIAQTARESEPWWPPRIVAPKTAPNILLIITDDSGFGVPSTFGGVIPHDTMDQLADEGLRFTAIHSTALCSPTRAGLLTGRNHHTVGFGVISESSTGFPGYNSVITKDKATIGRILRDNGYATSWFGKNHNTPAFQTSLAGPFDQWPIGMGFEYFYGFVGGDANQWQPNLYRNTTPIYPFEDAEPGWNLITATADDAITHITNLHQIAPDKPFFVKYAPGATHAPHHPTPEWVEKIEAMNLFDDGYEALRATIFENQKKLGLVPQDATLTPWPEDKIRKWEQLSDDERKLFVRQVEVFAAYASYSDHEIGRVIDAIDALGELENTLVIYINGDNGTSAEGGPVGTPNEVAWFNGIAEMPIEVQMQWYDVWGTEDTYNHMSAGWSWAFDTPFDYFKQNANRLGGVRQNMVVSWPNGIDDKGGLRDQFLHVIDVVPTILEVTGINAPLEVDGILQHPIEGTSFAHLFEAANADAPSPRKTQYFEMMGQWALYHEGWLLATKVNRMPWETPGVPNPDPLNNQVLELYDLTTDMNQQIDLAETNPDKVEELKALFIAEAEKYQVFPMDASVTSRLAQPRPNITAGRTEFVYTRPMTGLPQGDSPSILNASYTITAEIEVPEGGAEGMIVTSGGRFAGYGFYLKDGKPVFTWNLLNLDRVRWEAPDALPPGQHTVAFEFQYDGLGAGTLAYGSTSGMGQGGTGTLKVNGIAVDTRQMKQTIPVILQWDEAFDIGSDTLTGVHDADYVPPFALTARLDKLTIKVDQPQLTEADIATLEDARKRASD
ncbi:sulfatase [Dinoroseobacter shibae DFL 12 = DSM 16493]|jgi:arylsulfatase|uniref:Sulfatase n=1 Tax=Dinoroseobacter shibae (strain DSM 16493 / NCIMB 14021 / DFL 12) TaxID=398580 RepID=A8LRX4_DINSH|nr:arylsulfatase [Dinoroseobacter shibae]ABV92681.1 sulfatase [Dinoroseobacter shibae DFL 12 = DSM 16493]URF47616.1 sulfatase-like hydrolase/transferase [Dinoroseobacter shibae]URF51926.1 sulfatase-like hydrolase/transferase [Dinoroseobacter shibae]